MAVPTNAWRMSVFKNWLGAGGVGWVNSYQFRSADPIMPDALPLIAAAQLLVAYERELHLPSVFFDRVVISSWQADSTPYNPENLAVVPISQVGERDPGSSQRLDLNAVLNVRRATATGRLGKLAYRGVLLESDVDATEAGFWRLQAGSTLLPGGAVWEGAYAHLSDLLIDGEPVQLVVISVIDGIPMYREIKSLAPYGAGFNRMNHRWFDRPSS